MPASALLVIGALLFPTGSPQIYGPPAPAARALPGVQPGVAREVEKIRTDIDTGRDNGELSRRQAKHLRREAGEIGMLEERYASDGLSDPERAELVNRTEVLRAITNAKRAGLIK